MSLFDIFRGRRPTTSAEPHFDYAIEPPATPQGVGLAVYADDLSRRLPGTSRTAARMEQFSRESPDLWKPVHHMAQALLRIHWRLKRPASSRSRSTMRYLAALTDPQEFAEAVSNAEEDLVEIEDHPFLTILRRNLGAQLLSGAVLQRLTYSWNEIDGESYWLLGRNAGGRGVPVAALGIPPSWIAQHPRPGAALYRLTGALRHRSVPAADVLRIKMFPDLHEPYGPAWGPAQVAATELETIEHSTQTSRRAFHNGGPGVLIAGRGLDPGTRRELHRQWRRRREGMHGEGYPVMFMESEDQLQVHQMQQHFRNLQLAELSNLLRTQIRYVWGLPPSLEGNYSDTSGLGRSGIELEEYGFLRNAVLPRVKCLWDVWQDFIQREYGPDILLTYDNPVKEDREFALEAAKSFPHSLKVNEWRGLQGMEPIPEEDGGEAFVLGPGLFPVESLSPSEPEPGREEDLSLAEIDLI